MLDNDYSYPMLRNQCQQVYRQSLKKLTLIFLRAGESLSFDVTQAHQEQVQQLISGLALRLRNDSEWEPSPGEHCGLRRDNYIG